MMLVVQEYIRDEQEPAFYYHSDLCGNREQSRAGLSYAETEQSVRSNHLGSAAYLTNNGQVTQTLNYLPYGEDWVDIQHYMGARYSNMELYTFTGKEKDYESGYHYFGARYYDSEALTGWLSVDPMADKYPNMSPYNYCAWNPVKLVDDNGEFPGATRTVLALVAGALDMGAQMASNYLSGNSLMENIDYGSVTNSFLQTFLNPKKMAGKITKRSIDLISSAFTLSFVEGNPVPHIVIKEDFLNNSDFMFAFISLVSPAAASKMKLRSDGCNKAIANLRRQKQKMSGYGPKTQNMEQVKASRQRKIDAA